MAFLTQTNAKLVSSIFIGLAILTLLFAIDVCSEKMTTRKEKKKEQTEQNRKKQIFEKETFFSFSTKPVELPDELIPEFIFNCIWKLMINEPIYCSDAKRKC